MMSVSISKTGGLTVKTTRWSVIFWFVACVLSAGSVVWAEAQPEIQTHAEIAQWIEKHVPLYMERARMPGFSIAVVQDGKSIYAEGFGLRDSEKVLPATADTLYGIGSITKSFVAIGIMQLVEQGKISLDDPVSKHIPFELGLPDDPITIHHLLTHSLGIPSLATSTVAIDRGLGFDTGVPLGSAADFYRLVNGARNEIVAPPGERFFYHNAAWRMLGAIIQETTGVPFHQYLKEHVIDPLGMKRTTLSLTDFEADPDHILPHLKMGDAVVASRFPYPNPDLNLDFSFITAAGGIVSSVNEMTSYLDSLINNGGFEGGRLASKESLETMQQLHIQRPDGYYGQYGYGYGLGVTPNFFGHKMVGHGGSIAVSTAYMAFIPDLKIGVVMMGNSSGISYSPIAESIFAILMGKDPDEVIPALVIRARMENLTGSYEVYRGLEKLKVIRRGGLLYLEVMSPRTGKTTHTPLIPTDPSLGSTDFYVLRNGLKSPVEFVLRDDGNIDLFIGRYCYHRVD
jgi:CubicO group peptidase (beta-lactamase class C family)